MRKNNNHTQRHRTMATRQYKTILAAAGTGGTYELLQRVTGLDEDAFLSGIDELRAKIVCMISTPATRIAGVLQAPAGQVARVIAAKAAQGETA